MGFYGVSSAVSPLRRNPGWVQPLPSVDQAVAIERPTQPLHCLRPAVIAAAAADFVDAFPGAVMYAVKCNPEPRVLRALWRGGVRHFDCASPTEVQLIRAMFPDAVIHFMHPVKSREAIREAWASSVRDFALDSEDELNKILIETAAGGDAALGLFVRLTVCNRHAAFGLAGKFGADVEETARLLRLARRSAGTLGICFHVGSQCLDPTAFSDALNLAAVSMRQAAVPVDVIDVGGGFPVGYAVDQPPPLAAYFAEIEGTIERLGLTDRVQLWAEPGRALVAAGSSVVVQVLQRRDRDLYINDGTYGSLSDAGPAAGFRFPTRVVPVTDDDVLGPAIPYRFFGPTCDATDRMDGPFLLPAGIHEGHWIEIGQLGAYGAALRTAFNGYGGAQLIEVSDGPLLCAPPPMLQPQPC
jgi:ornithine decarboxylase